MKCVAQDTEQESICLKRMMGGPAATRWTVKVQGEESERRNRGPASCSVVWVANGGVPVRSCWPDIPWRQCNNQAREQRRRAVEMDACAKKQWGISLSCRNETNQEETRVSTVIKRVRDLATGDV